jgi:serine/threonine protein kinase/tetratricopeptide (TPR) repeat protein
MSDPDPSALTALPEPPPAAAAPERIGRYRIVRTLGQGGFGVVYLADDEQLRRSVAIKVPHAQLLTGPSDAASYIAEARIVAGLDHPNIVPVYDVGSTDRQPCFIVSKYIEGTTLAQRIKEGPLPASAAAELVAVVAETLHYAHRQGLVHRDVKPGNILIDMAGKPFVADFGLALKEEDYGKGARVCGTPAYMSPEQANGEGHRVDGRSDIFSLGVVFYELLTGRRPFRGEAAAVIAQIVADEPRPPRQIDDTIPRELERICLKALSKRAAERYTTAQDMADDLRHWSVVRGPSSVVKGDETSVVRGPSSPARDKPALPLTTDHGPRTTDSSLISGVPIKIVPKGLRSFDGHDAEFFLELLPGPRDRDGLPDSIRFWKTRIEEPDADETFTVGLLYGPSGCGKSSLVKAGLLPTLSGAVIAVYIEATAADTEARLLHGIRKRCPGLSGTVGLKDTLAALRRGEGIPAGKKVVIVLDQFEQWLHARHVDARTELVAALRQCDGARVQCVLMVRDDFWMAVTRFLAELEVELLQGVNSAAVDLFDSDHAEKVLAAYGRAFGKLPANPGETTAEQKEFIRQAVAGLAEGDKVICVRLSLFAEMIKGKPWTLASLKAAGGTEGVGVTFLEETFCSATAPPKHRYHQKAARAVLQALLPESAKDLKGHMRAHAELLAASEYMRRPKDFDDLVRILDSELRLITPTDSEGRQDDDGARPVPSTPSADAPPDGARYYQLTHDYLVPTLRDWLTRKQRETRRGRAALRLADRTALWNARHDKRQLPSWWEWANIRLYTRSRQWTASERAMMRVANRHHLIRTVGRLILIGVLIWVIFEALSYLIAYTLVETVRSNDKIQERKLVASLGLFRRWANPLLEGIVHDPVLPASRRASAYRILYNLADDWTDDRVLDSYLGIDVDDVREQILRSHSLNLSRTTRHNLFHQLRALIKDSTKPPAKRAVALVDLSVCGLGPPKQDEALLESVIHFLPVARLKTYVEGPALDNKAEHLQHLFCTWLLRQDPQNAAYVARQFLNVDRAPYAFVATLAPHRELLVKTCWSAVHDREAPAVMRLRALETLVFYEPDSPSWDQAGGQVLDIVKAAPARLVKPALFVDRLRVPPDQQLKPGAQTKAAHAILTVYRDRRLPRAVREIAEVELGAFRLPPQAIVAFIKDGLAISPVRLVNGADSSTEMEITNDGKTGTVRFNLLPPRAQPGIALLLLQELATPLPPAANDRDRGLLAAQKARCALAFLLTGGNGIDVVIPLEKGDRQIAVALESLLSATAMPPAVWIVTDPHAQRWATLAAVQLYAGKPETSRKTLRALQNFLTIDPGRTRLTGGVDGTTWVLAAHVQKGAGLVDEARQTLATLEQTKNAHTLARAGLAYLQLRDYHQASQWFTKAITVNPKSAEAHGNLAVVLLQMNRVREAVAVVDDARKAVAPPNWLQMRYTAARIYAQAASRRADTTPLDAAERSRLRKQALGCLREELLAWYALAGKTAPQLRQQAAANVRRLLSDGAFAGVRDARALESLPAEECRDWRALWIDANKLLAQAER